MGSLLVGASVAIGLGMSLNIPTIPVHHLEGHLLSPMLTEQIDYPFIALLVSGGHTSIVHVENYRSYRVLGSTLDDSVGECFDKVAKLMGLPYPGGPEIEKLARDGKEDAYQFPRPMLHVKSLDLSFSGLKTAVKTVWDNEQHTENVRNNIAASFQAACGDVLARKLTIACQKYKVNRAVIVGGVSANQYLRATISDAAEAINCRIIFPSLKYCTDNAAMIALCGWLHLENRSRSDIDFRVRSRWNLEDLN